MTRILFVCSGNLCRSPMAAALAEKMLSTAGIPAVVASAGTLGIYGSPAAANAIKVLEDVGVDLRRHSSQGISTVLLRAADHVVVMAPVHEQELLAREPAVAPKIRRLWEYTSPPGKLQEIEDPVGLPIEAFAECRETIVECLGVWIERLTKLS